MHNGITFRLSTYQAFFQRIPLIHPSAVTCCGQQSANHGDPPAAVEFRCYGVPTFRRLQAGKLPDNVSHLLLDLRPVQHNVSDCLGQIRRHGRESERGLVGSI